MHKHNKKTYKIRKYNLGWRVYALCLWGPGVVVEAGNKGRWVGH